MQTKSLSQQRSGQQAWNPMGSHAGAAITGFANGAKGQGGQQPTVQQQMHSLQRSSQQPNSGKLDLKSNGLGIQGEQGGAGPNIRAMNNR
jgi:hypothetical protein